MDKYLSQHDYVQDGELTVSITLSEYRELLRISTLWSERSREPRKVSLDTLDEPDDS